MMGTTILLSLAVMLGVMTSFVTSRVVDMTHPLGHRTVFWPGAPPFNFTVLKRGEQPDTRSWRESNYFALPEHGGTHVDAPSHFAKDRWRMDQVPASRLIGPGVVIDIRDRAYRNPDYLLTIDDIREWEDVNGRIPANAVLLVRSGWEEKYPDKVKVFNSTRVTDPRTFHFPAIHIDTARWLTTERSIIAVGVDTPSPDSPSTSTDYPVHQHLLGRDVIILEYVAGLHELPAKGTTVVIGAIKLEQGSGGPARIIGLVGEPTSAATAHRASISILACLALSVWLRGGLS